MRERAGSTAAWFSTLTTIHLQCTTHDCGPRQLLHAEIGATWQICFFSLSVFTNTGPLFFLVCLDKTQKESSLESERSRLVWFSKTPAMGKLSRVQVKLHATHRLSHGWFVVNFGVVVFGLKTKPWTSWLFPFLVQSLQPRSSAQVKKNASHHDKQAETDFTIQIAWRKMAEASTPFRKTLAHRCAQADFAETWYLD